MAEFEVPQAEEATEQTAILESIQDEAYDEANRQERAATDARFTELDTEEEEVETDPEEPQEPELRLPPIYPDPGTKTVESSNKE